MMWSATTEEIQKQNSLKSKSLDEHAG